jgi:phytanoyl-CoA hydroxylase
MSAANTLDTPTKALAEFEKIKTEFNTQGFVLLRGFFSPQIVQNAQRDLEGLVDRFIERLYSEGKITDRCTDAPFNTRLIKIAAQAPAEMPGQFNKELHLAGLFDIFLNKRLLDLVELFLGSELRLYPNYMCRPKLPEDPRTQVLWHQDAAYTAGYKIEGRLESLRMVNCWSPLVPARVANGCMQFIPKSHELGLIAHEWREHYLEMDRSILEPLMPSVINVEMDPGDIVFFSNLLFHQGLPNTTQQVRWSFDWRYQDATQPTLRTSKGQIARSRNPASGAITSAEQWAAAVWQ